MRVFITGDVHGEHSIHKFSASNFPEGYHLSKEDVVIVCGDFGIPWDFPLTRNYRRDEYWASWLNSKPWTTLIVPGNHENYDMIAEMEQKKMFGGVVREYKPSIFFLERGQIYTINERRYWAFGGALSIDQYRRMLGVSYWKQELPTASECEFGLSMLDNSSPIDYIITHTAPQSIVHKMFGLYVMDPKYHDPTCVFFEEVKDRTDFKRWWFGHFHENMEYGKYNCLFDEIKEIENEHN